MRMKKLLSGLLLGAVGCASAADHSRDLHSTQEREMTLGLVQKEIRLGMSQAAVVEALGSPNIVTKDTAGKEVWVYDKIATEASYSRSRSGLTGGVGGGGVPGNSLLLGLVSGSHSHESGASATTQRTLTVIIRYDSAGQVESCSYHASKF